MQQVYESINMAVFSFILHQKCIISPAPNLTIAMEINCNIIAIISFCSSNRSEFHCGPIFSDYRTIVCISSQKLVTRDVSFAWVKISRQSKIKTTLQKKTSCTWNSPHELSIIGHSLQRQMERIWFLMLFGFGSYLD